MYANQIFPQRRATFVSEWLISRDCNQELRWLDIMQTRIAPEKRLPRGARLQDFRMPAIHCGVLTLEFERRWTDTGLSEVNHIRGILVIAGVALRLLAGLPQVGIGFSPPSPPWRRRAPHHPRACLEIVCRR